MAEQENGGAAFPIPHSNEPGAYQSEPGMDLRDYFAAAALQGIVANDPTVSPDLLKMFGGHGMNRGDVAAKVAYSIADAMLRARKDSPHG